MQIFVMPPTAGLKRDDVMQAFEQHGVVLLRDHALDLDAFELFTHKFCDAFHQVGTRQRLRQASGDGFTTEVFRNNFILLGHSEGAYRPYPAPPEVCFFLCLIPPAVAGGETTLVDGAEMLRAIPEDLRRRLEEVGVTYEYIWEAKRWQSEFGLRSEDELRTLLSRFHGVRFDLKDNFLHLFYTTDAVVRSRSGVPVFANGVLAHLPNIAHPRYESLPVYVKKSNRVYFGDGKPFSNEVVNALIDAHDYVVYKHRWAANDMLVIDNTRYMHGREMTAEPCERILISRFGHVRSNAQ